MVCIVSVWSGDMQCQCVEWWYALSVCGVVVCAEGWRDGKGVIGTGGRPGFSALTNN